MGSGLCWGGILHGECKIGDAATDEHANLAWPPLLLGLGRRVVLKGAVASCWLPRCNFRHWLGAVEAGAAPGGDLPWMQLAALLGILGCAGTGISVS